MAAVTKGRGGPIVGINVTPMVDVVLVLLVIMMVSAVYIVSQSLKVELPEDGDFGSARQFTARRDDYQRRAILIREEANRSGGSDSGHEKSQGGQCGR